MGAKENTDQLTVPRSIRHQNILDIAAERPDASIDAIAREVPSATPDLVENVLEEHGDPAAEAPSTSSAKGTTAEESEELTEENPAEDLPTGDSDATTVDEPPEDRPEKTVDEQSGEEAATEESETPSAEVIGGEDAASTQPEETAARTVDQGSFDTSELTTKQREVFRIISEQPELTQAEIGDRLGVSTPTVSNRVNNIDGFEWANREEFAHKALSDHAPEPREENTDMNQHDTDLKTTVTQLTERLDTVEDELEKRANEASSQPDADPDLKHKVLHVCLQADSISEAEELQVIQKLDDW